MNTNILLKSFLFILGMLFLQQANASHILGAQLSYKHKGGNKWHMDLYVYRDCNGFNLPNSQILNWTSNCGSGSFAIPLDKIEEVEYQCSSVPSSCGNGGTEGIERHKYHMDITLPPGCNTIYFSWQNCCRNSSITSLQNPGSEQIYIEAMVDNTIANPNESIKPKNNDYGFIGCIGNTHSHIDDYKEKDKDSLNFVLTPCLSGPGTPVVYTGTHSGTAPLGAADPVTIDPLTGHLSYTPTSFHIAPMCVRVEEYRNGNLVGYTMKDIQLRVTSCANTLPTISGINGTPSYSMTVCPGDSACFFVTANDVDVADVILVSSNNDDVIKPEFSSLFSTSGTNPVTADFCWVPTLADTGSYTFLIGADDGNCPYLGFNNYAYTINVINAAAEDPVNAGPDVILCQGDTASLSAISTSPNIVSYQWSPTVGLDNPTGATTNAFPPTSTTYTVTATYASGCTSVDQVTVNIEQKPAISVSPNNINVCAGAAVTLMASSNGTGLDFDWTDPLFAPVADVEVGATSTITANVPATPGSHIWTVVVTNPITGCSNTEFVTLTVGQPPTTVECNQIYASPTGNIAGAGSSIDPVTIQEALRRSACNDLVIKLDTGVYNIDTALNITSFVTLEGGFIEEDNWTKTSALGATTIHRTANDPEGTPLVDQHLTAVQALSSNGFRLQDLKITTANAITPSTTTYGVYLNNCTDYHITRCEVTPGDGSAGIDGVDGCTGIAGDNNDLLDGAIGGTGANGTSGIADRDGGVGGAGGNLGIGCGGGTPTVGGTLGSFAAAGSGDGGDGADALAGIIVGGAGGGGGAGGKGSSRGGYGGAGGVGGTPITPPIGCSATASGLTGNGGNGGVGRLSDNDGGNGQAGLDGAAGCNGANGAAAHSGCRFIPGNGGDGMHGASGSGGGGGGGGGGDGTDTGGAGGGGGGGGAGGGAGTGGTGGGGSFGVYICSNGANGYIETSDINKGTKGAGSNKGNGGIGGHGGHDGGGGGGFGGSAGAGVGGDGGDGGHGGTGGDGGDGGTGDDGFEMEVYIDGTPLVEQDDNFDLAGQEVIHVENALCSNALIRFVDSSLVIPSVGTTWDFDLYSNHAVPATDVNNPAFALYDTTGRFTIDHDGAGSDEYRGFVNVIYPGNAPPTILSSANVIGQDSFQLCAGDFATFSTTTIGELYNWNFDGSIANPGNVQNVPSTQFNIAGAFTIELTVQTSCCGLSPIDTVYLFVSPTSTATAAVAPEFCQGESGVLTVLGLGVNDTIVWSPTTNLMITSNSTASVNPMDSTVYIATVYNQATGSLACPINLQFDVEVNPSPDVTLTPSPVNCNNNGQVLATPTLAGTYNFVWSNGVTDNGVPNSTITSLIEGDYSVTVTNTGTGCVDSFFVNVPTDPSSPQVFANNTIGVTCYGDSTGSVDIETSGGTGPFDYAWDPVVPGSAQTNIFGSYTVSNLAARNYTVTSTDAGGCISIDSFSITGPDSIFIDTIEVTPPYCLGAADGLIEVESSGGIGIRTYSWSTGLVSADSGILTPVPVGNYSVTVTDANGCSDSMNISLVAPGGYTSVTANVLSSYNGEDISCEGACDGVVTMAIVGGTAPLTFQWDDPSSSTTQNVSGLCPGLYNATVTDAVGCFDTASVMVSEPIGVTATIVSTTSVTCNAGNDGASNSTGAGGTGTLSYLWSDGQTTANATGLVANNYTISVSDINGCTDTVNTIVTEPSAVTITAAVDSQVTCNGGNNGQATASAGGGIGAITYLWSNGQTNPTATALGANTYTVTATDANLCQTITNVTITEPSAMSITSATDNNVSCNGGNNGQASSTASGGTGLITYLWSNGQTNTIATALVANTYTVSATDMNGCQIIDNVTVTEPSAVTATAITDNNTSCNGGNDGQATATGTGGTGAFTYLWNNGQTNATATGLVAAIYTVTASDVNGCQAVTMATITEPSALSVVASTTTNVSCNGGNDGQALANPSGGTGAVTYLWSNTQTNITATGLIANTYTVTATDANGCTAIDNTTITEPSAVTITAAADNPVSCNGGNDGQATAAGGGGTGAISYLWSNSQNTATATGLVANTYTVTATDANLCQAITNVTITEPSAMSITSSADINVSCNGGNNGQASVTASGGTGLITYLWSNGQTNSIATALVANTYSVSATDASGCQVTDNVTITEPSIVTVSAVVDNQASCNGAANGQATATGGGGTGAISYLWSNGQNVSTAINLAANIYTVTVTDVNSCQATTSVTITEPSAVMASLVSTTNVACHDDSTGAATINGTGGTGAIGYLWSDGQTTATATGLVASSYSATVSDAGACFDLISVTITQPSEVDVLAVVDNNTSCNGATDGQATATGSGGTGAITYLWSNGQSNPTATALAAGSYSVTATDANLCEATTSITVTEPSSVTITALTNNQVSCNGGNNGQITAVASGGTGTITYLWSNGQTNSIATGLAANIYTVSATDANSCQGTANITITEPSAVSVTATMDNNATCNGGNDGQATAAASGGTGTFNYFWNNGQNAATATGLSANTYTVTATDMNGCPASATTTITEPTAVNVLVTVDNHVTCNGLTDGQATATPSGGTAGYTFLWSDGQTAGTATGLAAGVYMVTVTDAVGCQTTGNTMINEPAQLAVNAITDNNVTCNGGNDGQLTASVTGGTGLKTYLWSNGQITATAIAVFAGTHTVTVTDANGCQAIDNGFVTEPAAINILSTVINHASCNGLLDGQALASATGGAGLITYLWSNGQILPLATGLAANTYTVTATDANACSATSSVTITEPTTVILSASTTQQVSCNGYSDGQTLANASGGTGVISYLWSNGGTNNTAISLAANTYSVTATDANGCSATASTTVTEPSAVTVTAVLDNDASCNGVNDGQATASSVGGTGAFTYQWSNGQTNATATGLGANVYTVTATDANACKATSSITISEPSAVSVSAITDNNVSCYAGSDGQATASASGGTGAITYLWSDGQNTATAIGLVAGVYNITATDINGCQAMSSATITEPSVLVVNAIVDNQATCNGNADGQATASSTGGTGAVTYMWSNGQNTATATGLAANIYTVTATDANACEATSSVTITEPTTVILSASTTQQVSCNGYSDGQTLANASGGTGVISYLWSNGGTNNTAISLAANTYSVTATDANGCSATASTTVTEPSAVTVTAVLDNDASCNGVNDGQATASSVGGTGAFTYQWSNGQTNATATGLGANVYTVTATDANACKATSSITISEPSAVSVSAITDNNVSCYAGSDGQATASASGGTGAITYLWSDGQNTATAIGLVAGFYNITATDINGCQAMSSATITEPSVLVVNAIVDNQATCNGNADGQATASSTGGTGAVTYLWSNGQNTATATGLAANTYTVTATDANACEATSSVTITEPTTVVLSASTTQQVSCNGGNDGQTLANASGGTGVISYLWSNGGTNNTAISLAANTYSVTATDANGCSATASTTVTEPSAVTVTAVLDNDASCNGVNDGQATASSVGGTGAFTYQWSNGQTNATATGLAANVYTVTATDANACKATSSITISEPSAVSVSAITDNNVSCNAGSDGQATASASGGTGAINYLWSNGQNTATATGLVAGVYNITATDINGCAATSSATITEPSVLVANATTINNTSCSGNNDGQATVSTTGGTGIMTYLWSNGQTTSLATGLVANTYTVTVTDLNGCQTMDSTTVDDAFPLSLTTLVNSQVTCNGGANGLAVAAASGGTGMLSYLWSNNQATVLATGLVANTYTVTVTDMNGCQMVDSVVITEPTAVNVSATTNNHVSCNGLNDGQVSSSASGGTGIITYQWSSGQTTAVATGLGANVYTITATDANGCEGTATATVTEPSAISMTVATDNHVSCNSGTDGQTSVSASGGAGTLSYLWNNGVTNVINPGLVANTYTVTVTDTNGCQVIMTTIVTEPTAINVTAVMDNPISCHGLNDGQASTSASGGTGAISYLWSNNATTTVITGLIANSYTVTATDSNGCTATDVTTVIEPTDLVLNLVLDNGISCNGANDGQASAIASGGTGVLNYFWNNGAGAGMVAAGLGPNSYTVTVTDNNGCFEMDSVVIIEPNAMALSLINVTDAGCYGSATGQITANATGGLGNYTYLWSDGQTSLVATGLTANTYTVTVSDANACETTDSVVINQGAPLPTPNIAAVNNVLCEGDSLQLLTTTAAFGYEWQFANGMLSNQQNPTLANTTLNDAGTYSLLIFDADGCQSLDTTILLTINANPTAPTVANNGPACNYGDSITLLASNVNGVSYEWFQSSTGNSVGMGQVWTLNNITTLDEGDYYVVVTGNGTVCSALSSNVTNVLVGGERPVAQADSFHVAANGTAQTINVIANDTMTLTWNIAINMPTVDGQLQNMTNGEFEITLPTGADNQSFIYEVCDNVCPTNCDTALVLITVDELLPCEIPNIITPNGDGSNDEFKVPCIGNPYQAEIIIFNRWGNKVYESNNYQNDWNGTNEGEELPDGTYFFIIQIADMDPIQGYVELRK